MDSVMAVLALTTFISTLLGGLLILKMRKYLPYFFAFSSGTVIAVAFLDILPESISAAQSSSISIHYLMLMVVASFFLYSLIERYVLSHDIGVSHDHIHAMGPVGAAGLIIHSFLDGLVLGAAFQVSNGLGYLVALAVIAHDFTDGINTVTLVMHGGRSSAIVHVFLFIDALAPLLGVFLTLAIVFDKAILALILAFFVGEFLYIGASNLLPATRSYRSFSLIAVMALGILIIAIVTTIL